MSLITNKLLSVNRGLSGAALYCKSSTQLFVVSVENPASMRVVGNTYDNGGISAMDVQNKIVYLFGQNFASFDVSDPFNIQEIGRVNGLSTGTGEQMELDLINNVAYIPTGFDDGVISVNIADPTNPSLLDSIANEDRYRFARALSVDSTNEKVYLLPYQEDWMASFDVTNPSNITELDLFGTTSPVAWGAWRSTIDVSNQILYVLDVLDVVRAIDISNPSSLSQIGTYDFSGFGDAPLAFQLALDSANNMAYVVLGASGYFLALDFSNPASISFVGSLYIENDYGGGLLAPGRITAVALNTSQSVAFITDTDFNKIISVDISNPASMSVISSVTVPSDPANMFIDIAT